MIACTGSSKYFEARKKRFLGDQARSLLSWGILLILLTYGIKLCN